MEQVHVINGLERDPQVIFAVGLQCDDGFFLLLAEVIEEFGKIKFASAYGKVFVFFAMVIMKVKLAEPGAEFVKP